MLLEMIYTFTNIATQLDPISITWISTSFQIYVSLLNIWCIPWFVRVSLIICSLLTIGILLTTPCVRLLLLVRGTITVEEGIISYEVVSLFSCKIRIILIELCRTSAFCCHIRIFWFNYFIFNCRRVYSRIWKCPF